MDCTFATFSLNCEPAAMSASAAASATSCTRMPVPELTIVARSPPNDSMVARAERRTFDAFLAPPLVLPRGRGGDNGFGGSPAWFSEQDVDRPVAFVVAPIAMAPVASPSNSGGSSPAAAFRRWKRRSPVGDNNNNSNNNHDSHDDHHLPPSSPGPEKNRRPSNPMARVLSSQASHLDSTW